MKKSAGIVAAFALTACSGHVVAPGSNAGGDVGRAELRQAPAVASARIASGAGVAAAALDYVHMQRAALGLTSLDTFGPLRAHVSLDGADHIRMEQLHGGVKVWGADIVAHVEPDGTLDSVGGNVVGAISGLDLAPTLSEDEALGVAKASYAQAAKAGQPLAYAREAKELVILPLEDGTARLAWHVSFLTELQAGLNPALWNYFIDAHDGSIVERFNALHTANSEASGPGGNVKVKRTWTMNLDVAPSGANYIMNTTQFQTGNLSGGTSGTGTVYSGASLTNYNPNDAAANDAHGFAEITIKMLSDWMGYNSIDEKGYKIISRLHYSTNYANAYWDGTEMTYGDGDGKNFYEMSGSLDVVAHEIDHGFTSNHSNLTYSAQSGGMNESFSDIAGTAAKFYYDAKSATFDLGGDILMPNAPDVPGTALRYMCTPSKDGASIDNISAYTSKLDVHYSSGVMNRAFCRAAKRLSGVDPDSATANATADGVKKAAKAFFVANAVYWPAGSTFNQGCQGVIDAATKTLKYPAGDISALGDAWKDVGATISTTASTTACVYTHVNDFTLALTPTTATAPAGGTATFMVQTGLATGSTAQSLALSLTSTAGLTGTFNPATVMSGATSTLTVNIPSSTAVGDAKFTVSAAGTSTRTVDGTVTVTAPPPDMAQLPPDLSDNGGTGGNGGGTGGGNGNHGGSSDSGCSVTPGAAGSSAGFGLFFLAFVVAAARVSRRRRA